MATSKGVTQSALTVTTFPSKPEDAFVAIIQKDEKAGTSTGFVNQRLSLGEFLKAISGLFPALKEEIINQLTKQIDTSHDALVDQMDSELGGMSAAIEAHNESMSSMVTQSMQSAAQMMQNMNTGLMQMQAGLTALTKDVSDKDAAQKKALDDFEVSSGNKLESLKSNLDERFQSAEKTAKEYTDTQLKALKESVGTGSNAGTVTADVGSNVDGYVMTKSGWQPVKAAQFKNMLSEIGITYDVRLARWFLDEGELEEGAVDNAGGLNETEQAKKDRADADKSDDPSVNPSKITTGGTGEKGEKDVNGNVVHDSSGGDIKMNEGDKNNPGSDNADPTTPTYGKYWDNGVATDAKAPYAQVDSPVTRQNVTPAIATNPGTPFAYLDSLTPTKTSTVVTDGNLEIAMCPVVKGADPITANANGYPITMGKTTRWQFFLSLALADTSNGSSILSLYPTLTYRLSDGSGKYIEFTLKRQGKRIVLFDAVSNTTIYAGYQESDESTVQFLVRPELFTSTFAPYKINDAGSLIGTYSATANATYVAGNAMSQTIQVSATTDGTFTGNVVYRPITGRPDESLFTKATDGASKGNVVFANGTTSPRTVYLDVLDATTSPVDLSGKWLTARSDNTYLSVGIVTNVGQRLDATKPAYLATPNRNGGYDVVIPTAKDNEKNGVYLAVIAYRKDKDGNLVAYGDQKENSPKFSIRFMETTESNSYGGIFLKPAGSNNGTSSSGPKYDGGLGIDYTVGFPSRSYYLGGNVYSRDKIFGDNGANYGGKIPNAGPIQAIFNLGLTGYTSAPETFPANVPKFSYKTVTKTKATITEFVYTGSFVLRVAVEDYDTRNVVSFDVPINVSMQGE